MIDLIRTDYRTHPIAPEEHATMQTANLGHGYHSIVFLFHHADRLTLLVELPEPLRMVQIATARDAVPKLQDIRVDGRSILQKPEIETDIVNRALQAGEKKTKRGRVWEFDAVIKGAGLLICTMG